LYALVADFDPTAALGTDKDEGMEQEGARGEEQEGARGRFMIQENEDGTTTIEM